jgi:putative sugar O-methyltransferase
MIMKNFLYLIDVYKKTKEDEKLFIHGQSIHWDRYYKENKKFYNLDNLINFRKNQILSEGLDDAMNLQNSFNLLEALKNFDGNFLKKHLPEKNVGNSQYSINFLGYWFDYGIIHHLKWYEEIEKYIKNNSFILEIGGGFGSLARIIINDKKCKYFLIDLPETNLVSNYYLQNYFPEKKIFNYSDYKEKILEDNIKDYDIFILPPKTLDKQNIKFDFIINTRSFQEMNKKTIKEYFNLIQSKVKSYGYFLNINRYFKSTVGEDIKFNEYPYDNLWNAEISKNSFLQDNHHFLLVQRQINEGNIKNELLKLKNYNKNYENSIFGRLPLIKHFKKFVWLISKTILINLFTKKFLKKLAKVIYNFSEIRN